MDTLVEVSIMSADLLTNGGTNGSLMWLGSAEELKTFANLALNIISDQGSELCIDQDHNAVNFEVQNIVYLKFYTTQELVFKTEQGDLLKNKFLETLRKYNEGEAVSFGGMAMKRKSLVSNITNKEACLFPDEDDVTENPEKPLTEGSWAAKNDLDQILMGPHHKPEDCVVTSQIEGENMQIKIKILEAEMYQLSFDLKEAKKENQELHDQLLRIQLSTVGNHNDNHNVPRSHVQVAGISHQTEDLKDLHERIFEPNKIGKGSGVIHINSHENRANEVLSGSKTPQFLGDLGPENIHHIARQIEAEDCSAFIANLQVELGCNGKRSTLELLQYDERYRIRSLTQLLKPYNRNDVIEEMRKILPAGTTGPVLDESKNIRDIPFSVRRKLTMELCVDDRWKYLAEQVKVDSTQMGFLDARVKNPADEVLRYWEVKANSSVRHLYDILLKLGYPQIADLL